MTAPANVDSGPKYRVREGDNLWYLHPTTGERFLSVTSVLDFAANEGLEYWGPGLTARWMLDNLPKVIRASRLQPCGRTYSRCTSGENGHDWRERCPACPCTECLECIYLEARNQRFAESRRARERGSAVHHWIEHWVLSGGEEREIESEYKPYTASFLDFVADLGLTPASWEMAEATVLNRTHGWGGTLDGQILLDATATPAARRLCKKWGKAEVRLRLDTKTREKDDAAFYKPMSLQLSAYHRGEVVLLDNGDEATMGEPADGAIVVQVRPTGYDVRPVRIRDEEYQAFVDLLGHARWSIEHGSASVAVRSFPDLPIPGIEEPVKTRRAPKKRVPPPSTEDTPAAAPAKRVAASTSTPRKSTARAKAPAQPAQPVLPEPARPGVMEQLRTPRARNGVLDDSDIPF